MLESSGEKPSPGAWLSMGINLIHRPVARPHYGGQIERPIGTMMGAVHFLPGSTSSVVASRGDYDLKNMPS